MSDGDNNCGDDIQAFLDEWQALKGAGEQVPEVHTLAIGNDAERNLLEELATTTGGAYNFVPDPPPEDEDSTGFRFGMVDVHRTAAIEISRQSQNFGFIGNSKLSETPLSPIVVDGGASQLVVNVAWKEAAPYNIVLTDPEGISEYPPTHSSPRHRLFKVAQPKPGFWQLLVLGVGDCAVDCGTDYIADASVDSILGMVVALGLPVEERIAGTPMPILAALSDTGPVTGATVLAQVRNPIDQDSVLALFDDGTHGDGAAGDGVYGNVYFPTWIPGSYRAQILALGSTPIVGGFARHDALPRGAERPSRSSPSSVSAQRRGENVVDLQTDGGIKSIVIITYTYFKRIISWQRHLLRASPATHHSETAPHDPPSGTHRGAPAKRVGSRVPAEKSREKTLVFRWGCAQRTWPCTARPMPAWRRAAARPTSSSSWACWPERTRSPSRSWSGEPLRIRTRSGPCWCCSRSEASSRGWAIPPMAAPAASP
jgi:hypothetical protein